MMGKNYKHYNIPIKMVIEGNEVEGKILECTRGYLEVAITKPYKNLTDWVHTPLIAVAAGGANVDKDGRLTDHCLGDAECMLKELYFRGKKIHHIKEKLRNDKKYLKEVRERLNYTRNIMNKISDVLVTDETYKDEFDKLTLMHNEGAIGRIFDDNGNFVKKFKYYIDEFEYKRKLIDINEKHYTYKLVMSYCMIEFFNYTFPEVIIPNNLEEEILNIIDGTS